MQSTYINQLPKRYGALLAGFLFAALLWAIVAIEVILL